MASLPSEDLVFLTSLSLTREGRQLLTIIVTDLAATVLFRWISCHGYQVLPPQDDDGVNLLLYAAGHCCSLAGGG